MLQHRADEHLDAEPAHGPLQPAAERHLVVEDRRGVAAGEVQVPGRPELTEYVVENPVRQLRVTRRVAEYAAEKADQRMHHLPADKRQRIDEHHAAAEPR